MPPQGPAPTFPPASDAAVALPDAALAAEVAGRLLEHGHAWPAPVQAFATLDSTSDRLKLLARAGAAEWSVVLSRVQTRGRGRQGRTWTSPPGNLYLSLLLRPGADLAVTLLPLAVGVAVADVLGGWGLGARLKWPNDVLVGERKIAGILVEATASGQGLDHAVVGVGLNLAWNPAADPSLARSATSVADELGRAPDIAAAAAALLARVANEYDVLAGDPGAVLAAWRARAVAWWGERVRVELGGAARTGRLRGVTDDGALVLEADDGSVLTLISGEVARLRPVATD